MDNAARHLQRARYVCRFETERNPPSQGWGGFRVVEKLHMRRRTDGLSTWVVVGGLGVRKPSQWLPLRERYYVMVVGKIEVLLCWRPFVGITPLSLKPVGSPGARDSIQYANLERNAVKRLNLGPPEGMPAIPLPGESAVLKKFPRICCFVTDTVYEDGTLRLPGYFWLKSDTMAFELTLFEPSACARARIRAATLDDVFALAEKFLGSDGGAWEVDKYLLERSTQKKKK